MQCFNIDNLKFKNIKLKKLLKNFNQTAVSWHLGRHVWLTANNCPLTQGWANCCFQQISVQLVKFSSK